MLKNLIKPITVGLTIVFFQTAIWSSDKNPTTLDNQEKSDTPSNRAPVVEVANKNQRDQGKSANPLAVFDIPWFSINTGGETEMSSTNFGLKSSLGQSVAGSAASTNYQMGIGFWYGPGLYCIAKPGDANTSGTYTLGDVISIVNYIFNKPGCSPQPLCWLSNLLCRGDWNGSGTITLGDVIRAVNYLFNKPGGPWNALASGVCCLP